MATIIPFPQPDVLRTTIIADIEFYDNSGLNIVIWKERQFYRLQGAYDFDILTQEDLREISEQWIKQQRDEQLKQLGIHD